MKEITIGNKQYKVKIAKTQEEKEKGLMDITELPKDEGMLFVYDKPQTLEFWMKDTKIPLDIVFIDEDYEVKSVKEGKPDDETILSEDDVQYVLEVNANSGIKKGDELDFDEEENNLPKMKVLAADGSVQMELDGGERIFSRKSTRVIIKKAKKAYVSQLDKDYKALGKYVFKELNKQDDRDPEYVTLKDNKD